VSLNLGVVAKYGIVGLMAVFPTLEAAAYGAMSVAVPASKFPLAELIRALAAVAIVVALAKEHGIYYGVAAALGIAGGWVASNTVRDVFLEGLSSLFAPFVGSVLEFAFKGFVLGLVVGFAVALTPLWFLSTAVGFALGLLVLLSNRAVSLIEKALDGVVHAIFKALPLGVKGLVAPYFGGVTVGMILVLSASWILFALGAAVGVATAILITALAFGWTIFLTVLEAVAFLGYVAGLILAEMVTKSEVEFLIFVDALLLIVFPWLGPALYTAGYVALLTRRKAMGLYLISLGVLSLCLPKLPFTLSL
jgi:hypothetical protein